jgi:type II secretory pathway component GspD/PulD (secretin)
VSRAAAPALAAALLLLGSTAVSAGAEPAVLRVESNTGGEVELDARGARIDEVLGEIASKTGVDVVIEPGIARQPVNMEVSMAPVEHVLRQILRGRNYALVYDGDDASLTSVIVLPPPAPRNPRMTARQRFQARRAGSVARRR